MKEALKTDVLIDIEGGSVGGELTVEYEGDTLQFLLDGRPMFGGDWSANFLPLFKRCLHMWAEYEHANED